jgi:glycosyltransferase involved in cell wall biosynthesis
MKVLYFHQHFTLPELGGGTRSYEFAKQLINKGHSVTVVCGESSRFNLKQTKAKAIRRGFVEGIEVIQISIPYSNYDSIAKRVWLFLKYSYLGINVAIKEDYDLIFATSTPLTAGIPGIVMKLFKKKKFVFEVRDLWPELPKALGLKNPILLWGMSLLEKWSYNYADACIGLSPGICNGIAKRSNKSKPIKLIPNGCDLDIFKPEYNKQMKLEGIKANDFVAVFTGAHGIANGLDAVLDAASILKGRGRLDIKLVFIGDGRLKPALKERAARENLDNCLFFKPISKLELNDIISNADIGLMILANIPEFYYGTSPNKFFDYISSGLPVLNNYPGWLADMINANKCGCVVPPDNPEAFANGIIMLSNDPEFRKIAGKNSRKLAESSFNRIEFADKFVKILESIHANQPIYKD